MDIIRSAALNILQPLVIIAFTNFCLSNSEVAASEVQSKSKGIAEQDANCDLTGTDPVLMVVSGQTLDASRMINYAKTLQASGLYPRLQGYYVNAARPIKVFEGDVPDNFVTLVVKFPSLCTAEEFWHDEQYQNDIKPLRQNPSAGDYTVTVYSVSDIPDYIHWED